MRTHDGIQRRPSRTFAVAYVLSSAILFVPVTAQQMSQSPELIRRALASFESRDWSERSRGFFDLLQLGLGAHLDGRTRLIQPALTRLKEANPASAEAIHVGLIRLLDRENAFVREMRTSEEYSEYRGELVAAVAALHDQRALDALLAVIGTGNLAVEGIAALGPFALERVIPLSRSEDVVTRNGATRVLARMVHPPGSPLPDKAAVAKIADALLARLNDSSRFVRTSAVQGLEAVPGDRVTAALRLTADTDSFRMVDANGRTKYPVREAAAKALLQRPKG